MSSSTASEKKLQIPSDIRTYLEGILEDAQMTFPDEQMKEDMLAQLFERFDNFMLTTIVESLTPEKLEEFKNMSDAGKNKTELENYLKSNISDAPKVFARAMVAFRDIYVGNVGAARETNSTEN